MSFANDQLRLFMERIDRLEDEKKGISSDISDVYKEAKMQGYNPKVMRELRKRMKMSKDDRDNFEAELETYKIAVGLEGTPLGDAIDRGLVTADNVTMTINGRPVERLDPLKVSAEIASIFDDDDHLFKQVCEVLRVEGKCSTSFIQRRLAISYNKAAKMVDRLEDEGFVSAPDHVGKRSIIHGRLN